MFSTEKPPGKSDFDRTPVRTVFSLSYELQSFSCILKIVHTSTLQYVQTLVPTSSFNANICDDDTFWDQIENDIDDDCEYDFDPLPLIQAELITPKGLVSTIGAPN